MPTFRLVGFAPGTSVELTVSQGGVTAAAAVPSWGTPLGDYPQLSQGSETGFAIEVVSEDLLGPLSLTMDVDGITLGPFVRSAAEQVTGVPVNHVLPEISSTALPGIYAASSGLWTHGLDPAPTPVYQWTRGGVAISGASSASYTSAASDSGAELRCVVTVDGVVASSAAVAVPGAGSGLSVAAGTDGITFSSAGGLAVSAGTGGIIFAEA